METGKNNCNTFSFRPTPPASPLSFNKEKCVGCNQCLEACQMDVMLPAAEKGNPPIVAYPEECWYCGCCVMECPKDAIHLKHPLMNQTRFVEKASLLKENNK